MDVKLQGNIDDAVDNVSTFMENTFVNGFWSFLIGCVLIVVAAIIVLLVLKRLFDRRVKRGKSDLTLLRSISRGIVYFLAILGICWQITPLKNIAVSIIAGSGVLAIGLSLASQDAMSNLVSGLLISVFKPFTVGDTIKINDTIGIVELINMRQTVLTTYSNNRMVIPNSVINTSTVENFTLTDPKICTFFTVGVAYDTDITNALAVLQKTAEECPGVIDARTPEQTAGGEPKVTVRCNELGSSGITLMAAIWTEDKGASYAVLSELRQRVLREFNKAGIEIPFPYSNIIIKK